MWIGSRRNVRKKDEMMNDDDFKTVFVFRTREGKP